MVNLMTKQSVLAALILASLGAGVASAQQRPLVTEDPETIGTGNVLIEGGFSYDMDLTNEVMGIRFDRTRVASLGVSVGISPSAEVQVDGGLLQQLRVSELLPNAPLITRTRLRADDTLISLEDLIVATKIRLASETPGRPAIGVRFGTKLPFSDPDQGIGLGTTDFFASFLIAKTVRSVRTVGNAGLLMLGNPQDSRDPITTFGFGLSVARALTDAFELVGEINGKVDPFEDVVPTELLGNAAFRFAGRYTYAFLRLDFGVLLGITERDPTWGFSAGATYVISRRGNQPTP